MLFLDIGIVVTALIVAAIIAVPLYRRLPVWRAVITPLASIIGSGFLVLGPILDAGFGKFAPIVMAGLCGCAFLFGMAIRYNIKMIDANAQGAAARKFEAASDWALAFAYIISVSYYLNLFGAFALSLTPFDTPLNARLLTSFVFVVIIGIGWIRGFESLERIEYVSVPLNLSIIAGLLVGLAVNFSNHATGGLLVFNPVEQSGWSAITLTFGLLITVQGFETSRYLGDEYDAPTREKSMRWAQLISTVIYMIYIALISYVFAKDELSLTETGIIDMMKHVAPILPPMLVAAALASQFSAAIADTSGSGGLFEEISRRRLSQRQAYLILGVVGLGLTWSANVFEIISYASRAFAAYYALQAMVAALTAFQHTRSNPSSDRTIHFAHHGYNFASARGWVFTGLAIWGLMIAAFGQSAAG